MSATVSTPDLADPTRIGRNTIRCGIIIVTTTFVGVFFACGGHEAMFVEGILADLGSLQSEVHQKPLFAIGLFFLVYLVTTALSLPAAGPLTLLAGALFGSWVGTGVALIASTLGATLAFLLCRFVFQDLVRAWFGARLTSIDRQVTKHGVYYLLTLRLVPVAPFFLVNLGMGLTAMRTFTFAAVSFIGMLPGTFLYAHAGTALATMKAPSDILSPPVLGTFTLLCGLPLLCRLTIPRHRRSSP